MFRIKKAPQDITGLDTVSPGRQKAHSARNTIDMSIHREGWVPTGEKDNTRGGLGVQNVEMSPPVDSMQEFKVEVNSMGAGALPEWMAFRRSCLLNGF